MELAAGKKEYDDNSKTQPPQASNEDRERVALDLKGWYAAKNHRTTTIGGVLQCLWGGRHFYALSLVGRKILFACGNRDPIYAGCPSYHNLHMKEKWDEIPEPSSSQGISKKERKGLMLRPCSVNMSSCTKEEQTNVREVSMEQERKEKMLLMEDEISIKEVLHELPGIPRIPSNNSTKSGIIFIFEMASLVPALVGKTLQILNPDDHANFLRRHKKNPYDYRPEIIHQALLELLKLLQKFRLSYSSEKRVRLKDYVGALNDDVNLVFVVGAMAHGKINCDYTDEVVSEFLNIH
ncbi:hypothetical protein OROHE_008963 [Orobanche hederae]